MNAGLLGKLFGSKKQWHGPCTVMLDADASITASGADSIVNAGVKAYAPRLISGRLSADGICYLPDEQAIVMVQINRIRQSGVEDRLKAVYTIADLAHVAAIEFADGNPLAGLELPEPPTLANPGSKPRI